MTLAIEESLKPRFDHLSVLGHAVLPTPPTSLEVAEGFTEAVPVADCYGLKRGAHNHESCLLLQVGCHQPYLT